MKAREKSGRSAPGDGIEPRLSLWLASPNAIPTTKPEQQQQRQRHPPNLRIIHDHSAPTFLARQTENATCVQDRPNLKPHWRLREPLSVLPDTAHAALCSASRALEATSRSAWAEHGAGSGVEVPTRQRAGERRLPDSAAL
ncbi:unnamed protein product [Lampetra planeri]